MLKINYSSKDFEKASDNEEGVVMPGLELGESLDHLAMNDDVVVDPTLAPAVESAANIEANNGEILPESGEAFDENPVASPADAGQDDITGGHNGVFAPVGVTSNVEENVTGYAEAYAEANFDDLNGTVYNPRAGVSYNPYADPRVNPFVYSCLNGFTPYAGQNPYAMASINTYALGGLNRYAFSGMNPYAYSGHNPYAYSGHNPYAYSGHNLYAYSGHNPYAYSGHNPYAAPGYNPYALEGLTTYAISGYNPYGNVGSNLYPEPKINSSHGDANPNPYVDTFPNANFEANPEPYVEAVPEPQYIETVPQPSAESTPEENNNNNNKAPDGENESSTIVNTELLFKHPLQNTWTLWYLENDRTKSWTEMQNEITSFDTVEDFWSLYNYIKPPSELKMGSDYSLFKNNIRPMWEDEANQNGGRWVITLNKSFKVDLDNLWLDVILCLIGEAFDYSDEVCGAVVNIRGKNNKISIWTANGNMKHAAMEIGRKLCDALCLGRHNYLQYQLHTDTMMKGSDVHSIYTL